MSKTNVHDPKTAAHESILTMPLDELRARVVKAIALWQQILALLPGGVVLTDNERGHTRGRLRDGESAQMLTVLDVCEKFPALFESLVDLDEGVDPTKFETPLLRDRLQRAEILAPLADALSNTQLLSITDTVLHLRDLARTPISEAYGIAKSIAKTNVALKTMLAPVLDFYRALAELAAAARKANQDAKPKG
jgi:hypothetical protein